MNELCRQLEEFEEACSTGNIEKVENLFPAVKNDVYIDYMLSQAVSIGSEEVVKFLLVNGGDPDSEDVLYNACMGQDVEVTKLLLKSGANPNRDDILFDVCESASLTEDFDIEIIKLLLEHGADPNENGALYISCCFECLGVVKLLLQYKANPFIINYQHTLEKNTVLSYLIENKLVSEEWIKDHLDMIPEQVWEEIYE